MSDMAKRWYAAIRPFRVPRPLTLQPPKMHRTGTSSTGAWTEKNPT